MKRNPGASVRTINGLMSLDSTVTQIIIDNGVGEPDFTVLDMTGFTKLKSLEIGDHCFSYVEEVRMIGMNELESVAIGSKSFSKCKDQYITTSDPNRHFYLKNCRKLKSLKIGCYSFSDYTLCEIENVLSVKVIEIGDLNEKSFCFRYGSLKLKSGIAESE